MELFLLLNVVTCLTTGTILFTFIKKQRYLLVKPSIIYLLFFYMLIQIPATIYSATTFTKLGNWLDYFILSQLYPLISVLVAVLTFKDTAELVYSRLALKRMIFNTPVCCLYFAALVVITVYYLIVVGISNTGIYAIIFGLAEQADIAREESLKMVDSSLVKYSYSLLGSAIAPVLLAMLVLRVKEVWRVRERRGTIVLGIVGSLLCFLAVSFPGHRWGPMLMIVTMFFTFQYGSGCCNVRLRNVFSMGCILLVTMALISVRREGVDFLGLGLGGSLKYLFQNDNIFEIESWSKSNSGLFWSMSYRILLDQMKSGWDYARYVYEYGYWGLQAIPKLAFLVGMDPINVANQLNNYYYPAASVKSGYYTTGFVFFYYSSFGIGSFIPSMVFTAGLDILLLLYTYLDDGLLLPVVSVVSVSSLSLIGAEYTTSLLSHGILSSIVIALGFQTLADWATRIVYSNRYPDRSS